MQDVKFQWIALALLLFSILIRALVGQAGSYQCPKASTALFALGSAAFAGKALGGILSDRFGWTLTSVTALLISAPLIALGGPNYTIIALGMFFFQMTMPVTLSAISMIMPGRPGFSFGLASLVLIAGTLPTYFSEPRAYYSPGAFFAVILISAVAIFFGLKRVNGTP